MTTLIIICAVLLFFVILCLLPLRIRISYGDDINIIIPILFWKIQLYPKNRKLRSMSAKKYRKLTASKKKKSKSSKTKASSVTSKTENKNKISFSTIKPLIGDITSHVLSIITKFSNHLNVKIYSLWVIVSSGDAATTAITYGAVCSSFSVLMSLLHDNCNIKYSRNAKTGVFVDYTLGECVFDCDIRFTLRVWQIISLIFTAAVAFIKTKMKLEDNKNVGKQDQRHDKNLAGKH